MHEEKDWQLDIEELKALIRPNTKLIVIKYAASITKLSRYRDTDDIHQ